MTDYEYGFQQGYARARIGVECRFFVAERRSDGTTRYGERSARTWTAVEEDRAELASGYIDGFMRAEADTH